MENEFQMKQGARTPHLYLGESRNCTDVTRTPPAHHGGVLSDECAELPEARLLLSLGRPGVQAGTLHA